jgi:hypothetical protein
MNAAEKFIKENDANSPYLRFFMMISIVKDESRIENLNADEMELFGIICVNWSFEKPLKVNDAINNPRLGSAATLHKRLQRLRDMNMIDDIKKDGDKRTKYLHPSSKGMVYLKWLDSMLLRSIHP